jgi:hypothetical protein
MPGARLYILVPLLLIIVGGATTGFFRASGQDRQEGFWASWEYTGRPSLTMITEFRSRIGASEWPPFTLVYELEQGQSVMVGNRQIDSRQVRRYEYVSPTEWKDTVLESAPTDTRVGIFSNVGSYQMVDGRRYTEFDAATNSFRKDTVDRGTRRVPIGIPTPFHMLGFELEGQQPTRVVTTATVCFQEDCQPNAGGLFYTSENGREYVFADDTRGIPLRVGTGFLVRELRVEDERK